MTGPESRLKARVMMRLKAIPNSHWYKIQQRTINGTPDILGVVNGCFVALELKSMTGKPTTLQEFELMMITKAGGYAKLVDESNMLEVIAAIKQLE